MEQNQTGSSTHSYDASIQEFWREHSFLDCAPRTLIESLYNSRNDLSEMSVMLGHIECSLCKGEGMEKVWLELKQKFNYLFMFNGFATELVSVIYRALYHRDGWDELTPSEKINKKDEIIAGLNKLSRELYRYPVNLNVLTVLTKRELKVLFQNENERVSIDAGLFPYNPLGVPNLADFLERIALKLNESDPPSTVSHREKSDIKLLHKRFFRELAAFFRKEFKSPNYSTLAVLGNLFLPGNYFDKDTVRALVQDRRKPSDK